MFTHTVYFIKNDGIHSFYYEVLLVVGLYITYYLEEGNETDDYSSLVSSVEMVIVFLLILVVACIFGNAEILSPYLIFTISFRWQSNKLLSAFTLSTKADPPTFCSS